MSGDHNQYQKDKSYLDFNCPRCGHCCTDDYERGFVDGMQHQMKSSVDKVLNEKQEPLCWTVSTGWVYDDDISQDHVDESVKDEHEPVAWANSFDLQNFDMKVRTGPDLHHTVPLYTAPPKREWVGLTALEIYECWKTGDVVEAVETKLKEKNNG